MDDGSRARRQRPPLPLFDRRGWSPCGRRGRGAAEPDCQWGRGGSPSPAGRQCPASTAALRRLVARQTQAGWVWEHGVGTANTMKQHMVPVSFQSKSIKGRIVNIMSSQTGCKVNTNDSVQLLNVCQTIEREFSYLFIFKSFFQDFINRPMRRSSADTPGD